VHRAYKFLLRPTVRQTQALSEMLRDHCSLYNAALQERRDACRLSAHRPAGAAPPDCSRLPNSQYELGERVGHPRIGLTAHAPPD
jgi:hypothetical protein